MQAHRQREWLEIEQFGPVTVAKFTTHTLIEEEKLRAVGERLLELGEQVGRHPLLLDFAGVQRLSSEMMGKLLGLQRRVQARGGRLALCNISPAIREIFSILRLTTLFTIYEDEQEALQKLQDLRLVRSGRHT